LKAVVYDRFGGVDVLRSAEIAEPVAAKGQVVVSVKAAALNVIDTRTRRGLMGILVNKTFPKIPGADLAGVVRQVGPSVTGIAVGDAVYGACDPLKGGALAQSVALDAGQLAIKPVVLSFEEAAALPIAGLAALGALRDLGRVREGSSVLIHGASGGVGLFAVQIGRYLGAHVTAVAGTAAMDRLRDLGANETVDYRRQASPDFGRHFDCILNASGKLPFSQARSWLKPDGRHIEPSPTILVFIGSRVANLFRLQKHLMLQTVPRRADLQTLGSLVERGPLKITVAAAFPMDDIREAFTQLEAGGTLGKIVVRIP